MCILVGTAVLIRLGIHWWFREKRAALLKTLEIEMEKEQDDE